MSVDLYRNVGEMAYDGLITDIYPAIVVRGGTIRKLAAAATLSRGTILAKSGGTAGDGKLVILGTSAVSNETLTPYAILAEDTAVGTSADAVASIYYAGCFDLAKCIVDEGYDITDADLDALRGWNIVFKTPQAAN